MELKQLILLFLTFGFFLSAPDAFACHKMNAHSSHTQGNATTDKKDHCCSKSKSSKKKAFCKHHKPCKNCNCQCTYSGTFLAISTPLEQGHELCGIAIKKNYKPIAPTFISEGYFCPWAPPKIS